MCVNVWVEVCLYVHVRVGVCRCGGVDVWVGVCLYVRVRVSVCVDVGVFVWVVSVYMCKTISFEFNHNPISSHNIISLKYNN